MLVAKTYENWEKIGEPYRKDNLKTYIKVRNPRTKTEKEIRVYTQVEYNKIYNLKPKEENPIQKTLGFNKGYITIFQGDQENETNKIWFKKSNARWAKWWGWYIVSTEDIPTNLPFGIKPVKLFWEDVSIYGALKPEDKIAEVVDALLYEKSDSTFVGNIGERLNLILRVEKVIPLETLYGLTNMHIMHDYSGNEFVWATRSKKLEVDKEYEIKGTIKRHGVYKGINQNFLTRCSVK